MSRLIDTPYGRKTPELICAGMDALELVRQALDDPDSEILGEDWIRQATALLAKVPA